MFNHESLHSRGKMHKVKPFEAPGDRCVDISLLTVLMHSSYAGGEGFRMTNEIMSIQTFN